MTPTTTALLIPRFAPGRVRWVAAPEGWAGVTVATQAEADKRIPGLLDKHSTAAIAILEMTGPIDLTPWLSPPDFPRGRYQAGPGQPVYGHWEIDEYTDGVGPIILDCVIVRGQTGPDARPLHPEWVRSIRDQCEAAGVPFAFAGWGRFVPVCEVPDIIERRAFNRIPSKTGWPFGGMGPHMIDLNGDSGVLTLDGREHVDLPAGARP